MAKSMICVDVTRRIEGASLFTHLMTKDTTRSELFGPPSIKALEEGRYEYITTGRLAESDLAFLDECFKSSSAVLNSLLTAINERQFDNGGQRVTIPLMSLFTASNELPQGEELAALYDRILLRYYVRDLDSDSDFMKLLVKEPHLNGSPTVLTADELDELQGKVSAVKIPEAILEKIVTLRSKLRTEAGITASPRRWLSALKLVRAQAVLAERDTAIEDDLEILQHCLWDTLDEKTKVAAVVLGTVNPTNVQALALVDQADDAHQKVKTLVESGQDQEKVGLAASEALHKLGDVYDKLEELKKSASGPTLERIDKFMDRVRDQLEFVTMKGLRLSGKSLSFRKGSK